MTIIVVDTNAAETPLFHSVCAHLGARLGVGGKRCVVRERLDVGDVAIRDSYGRTLQTFEVKRGADWHASIVDKRLYEQRARARDNAETFGQFAYIFQGLFPSNDDALVYGGRVKGKVVYGSVRRTSLRDGLHVFHTASQVETAELVVFALDLAIAGKLAAQATQAATATATAVPAPAPAPLTVSETGAGKRKADWALEHPTRAALLSIPGMGMLAAKALEDSFDSLVDILLADEERLADVVMDNDRRVGRALARKVKAL